MTESGLFKHPLRTCPANRCRPLDRVGSEAIREHFRVCTPSELCAKARALDGIARRASGQVRSYFGTWAASRAKTIFAILIASCSLKRWVQVAAFTCW